MLYGRVDGSLSVDQRRTIIHKFNTLPEIRILLLSYGVGSVGCVYLAYSFAVSTNLVAD